MQKYNGLSTKQEDQLWVISGGTQIWKKHAQAYSPIPRNNKNTPTCRAEQSQFTSLTLLTLLKPDKNFFFFFFLIKHHVIRSCPCNCYRVALKNPSHIVRPAELPFFTQKNWCHSISSGLEDSFFFFFFKY